MVTQVPTTFTACVWALQSLVEGREDLTLQIAAVRRAVQRRASGLSLIRITRHAIRNAHQSHFLIADTRRSGECAVILL